MTLNTPHNCTSFLTPGITECILSLTVPTFRVVDCCSSTVSEKLLSLLSINAHEVIIDVADGIAVRWTVITGGSQLALCHRHGDQTSDKQPRGIKALACYCDPLAGGPGRMLSFQISALLLPVTWRVTWNYRKC